MKPTVSSPFSPLSSDICVKETQASGAERSCKVHDSTWNFEKERDLYVYFQMSLIMLCGFALGYLHRGTFVFVIKPWK